MPLVEARTLADPASADAARRDGGAGRRNAAPTTAAAPIACGTSTRPGWRAAGRCSPQNCIVCHSSIQPPERFAEMEKFAKLGEFWDHDPGIG